MPLAFSYVRFSHPSQAAGDSLRRQTEAAEAWCRKNGVHLDTSTTLHDLGKSAFTGEHRKNPDRHALAGFLKLVEDGKVPRGSYLVIENLDRLSREHIQPVLLLALNLLQAGIRIVQLKPAEMVFDDKSDTMPVMMMMMELSRGHGESSIKSERVGKAWREKKSAAREERSCQTSRLPAWVEVVGRRTVGKHRVGGTMRLIPERVAVVRRIIDLALHGYGLALIVKKLTADKVPPMGDTRKRREDGTEYVPGWSKAYVRKILTSRALLGEYQPRKNGVAEGPVIPDYYPAVPGIDESVLTKVRGELAARKDRAGRVSTKTVSLFSGLVHDALTGEKLLFAWQTRGSGKNRTKVRVLVQAASLEGRSGCLTFPAVVFEDAILSLLKEVNPDDVADETAGESVGLAAELAGVEARLKDIEAELTGDGGDTPVLARVAAGLEHKARELRERLDAAQQRESRPPDAALVEAKTLIDVARDESVRLRLRGLLRQAIESIRVVIVPRRSIRLAAVQIRFGAGKNKDKVRDYLITYKAAGNGREGGWWCRSLATVAAPGDVDLRDATHAARLAEALAAVDLNGDGDGDE